METEDREQMRYSKCQTENKEAAKFCFNAGRGYIIGGGLTFFRSQLNNLKVPDC